MDDTLFEDKPFGHNETAKESEQDDSLFEDVPHPQAAVQNEEPSMGRTEAAVTSFGQGAGMGLAPIASGIVGAGANLVEQAGDVLGLSTDAELQSQGFTMPDKKTGLEGLMQAYYESRDAQKRQQEKAHEAYPVQSIALNVAGAIPSSVAGGAAAQGSKVLSKILPASQNLNQATRGAKIAAGIQEGAKAGALAGFGEGEARLLEGELPQAIEETAGGATGGAVLGGLIPGVTGLAKGIASKVPGAQSAMTGFNLGKAGIDASEEGVGKAVKQYSEDLLGAIRQKFRDAGRTKANAMDYADEVGIRVNAGENFDEVMNEIIERGAASVEDQAEKLKLYRSLKGLKEGPVNKAEQGLDAGRARNIQRMNEKGFDVVQDDTMSDAIQDLVPGSQNQGNILGASQTFQKGLVDEAGNPLIGKDGMPIMQNVGRIVQRAEEVLPIDIKRFDLENLGLRDLEQIIGEVNRHTGDLTGPAIGDTQKLARQLAGQLRTLSQDALEQGGAQGNNQLSNIFSAARRAGIDEGDILTKNTERTNNMVDALRKMVTSGDRVRAERTFEYLKKADPEFAKYENVGQFLNQASGIVKGVDQAVKSAGWEGLKGSVPAAVVKGSNVAGKAVNSFHKLSAAVPEQLNQLAQKLGAPGMSKAAQSYASPLMKAAQADDRTRTAILYGLYQQPAFRKFYEDMGQDINESIGGTIPGVESEDK